MRNPWTVYRWLVDETDNSNYHNIVFRNYAVQTRQALETLRMPDAWRFLQRLQTFTEESKDPFLFFEGRLLLGLAAFQARALQKAAAWIEEAINGLDPHQPHTATARWMKGCVLMDDLRRYGQGLWAWQQSLNDIEHLVLWPGILLREQVELMRARMREAIEKELASAGNQPRAGVSPQLRPPASGTQPGPQQPSGPRPSTPPAGSWPVNQPAPSAPGSAGPAFRPLTFSVPFDKIQAGRPARMGVDVEAYDWLDADQVIINNQRYNIETPSGSSAPPEVRLKEYFVLLVKGDSMNRAGIHEGDYVLLHQQSNAVNNNIVAVEISGVEHEATLKRYRVTDGGRRVVIQPESDNPVHQPREFTNGENANNRYRILGVVVAVLKRV